MTHATKTADKNRGPLKTFSAGMASSVLIVAMIFVIAGRLNYWQAWVCGGLNIFFYLLTAVSFAGKPEFAKERINFGPGMKGWDKVCFAASTPAFARDLVRIWLSCWPFSALSVAWEGYGTPGV